MWNNGNNEEEFLEMLSKCGEIASNTYTNLERLIIYTRKIIKKWKKRKKIVTEKIEITSKWNINSKNKKNKI